MALDSWLFTQHCAGLHPPALRFYTWAPAALSLGYHQRRYPAAWQTLTWNQQPLHLVRRPTGGRAVLHQGDLTYTVVMSGLPNRRVAAYRHLCSFLIEGWRSLGVELQYGEAGRGYIHNPNCFGTATGADLILPTGTKLIGSAQLRRNDAVLQHGSMRLAPDPELFWQVFGEQIDAPSGLPQGIESNRLMLVEVLARAAERCFGMQLVSQPLSDEEWRSVKAIAPQFTQETPPQDP